MSVSAVPNKVTRGVDNTEPNLWAKQSKLRSSHIFSFDSSHKTQISIW